MRGAVLLLCLMTGLPANAGAEDLVQVSYLGGLGACFVPAQPYPYKLSKTDPLYETAREDHQRYLEELEDYVNCLDRERGQALNDLRSAFLLFQNNFGKDAVLKYGTEPADAQ